MRQERISRRRPLPWYTLAVCSYLNAVMTEALRFYPPVPVGGPRVSPGAYVDGVYIPAEVSLIPLIPVLSPANSTD